MTPEHSLGQLRLFPISVSPDHTPLSPYDRALQRFAFPLFRQLDLLRSLVSDPALLPIDPLEPRLTMDQWNPRSAKRRSEFRRRVTSDLVQQLLSTSKPEWKARLREFCWPLDNPNLQIAQTDAVAMLYPGCTHLLRYERGGQIGLALQERGVRTHHFLSGQCAPAGVDEVRPTFGNTEADQGRSVLQGMGIHSWLIHPLMGATDTNGNVRDWLVGLKDLLPAWSQAIVCSDSFHILRTLFSARIALAFRFGDREVTALVTHSSQLDSTKMGYEKFIGYHVEGFMSALYDWATFQEALSVDHWLDSRGLILD